MLCYDVLRCAVLCCAMLSFVVLCCVFLYCIVLRPCVLLHKCNQACQESPSNIARVSVQLLTSVSGKFLGN